MYSNVKTTLTDIQTDKQFAGYFTGIGCYFAMQVPRIVQLPWNFQISFQITLLGISSAIVIFNTITSNAERNAAINFCT